MAAAIGDFAIVSRLARAPWPYTLADAEAFLAADHGSLPNFLIFARTLGAPRLVGGIALDATEEGVELGYWIARSYWGLGFATEAGRAMMDIADNGLRLPTLRAGHFADNAASGRVLTKLGFQPTGTLSTRMCRARDMVVNCVEFERRAFATTSSDEDASIGYDREAALAA